MVSMAPNEGVVPDAGSTNPDPGTVTGPPNDRAARIGELDDAPLERDARGLGSEL